MVTSDLGACEWFVWDLRRSGLIDRGQLDTIVGEFLRRNPRAEPAALAEYLVSQGTLTAFQAERVLNGKTQGLVLGPYVLLDAIGSGSMGQVYKASSKNDSNLYAVKVLPRRSMWNVRLARRQVRAFGNFTHPAVVPFVDVGTAGGLHYLVWPLAEGTPLDTLVQQQGKLPPSQAALYALQVAQGLTEAHKHSVFHGLIKPSNILIGPDNQARILDFGIGSLLVENEGESLVDTMSTANTLTSGLDCASPESIMEPTNRTPAGDQYSLGCVLYYCLTGRFPFPEGSAVEKMMAHQSKEPTPIRELAPDVPEGLVAVVRRLMAKKPEDRYTGCDEVVEALEPFVGDLGPTARGVDSLTGSGGRLPSLGGRSGPRMPGLPPTSPTTTPAPAFGPRVMPGAAGPVTPGVGLPGRPQPAGPVRPSVSVPSRASISLTAAPEPANEGFPTPTPPPVRRPETRPGPLPTRAATVAPAGRPAAPAEPEAEPAWANETAEPPTGRSALGPIGLVAVALILMVSVYFGATMLLKQ